MSGKIFVLQDGGSLVAMNEQGYDAEAVLQKLIEDYPDLLAGDQMNSDAPRRWLLVKREMGVPDALDGSGRWSLDHLFLDQNGVPTLVEVKRSTDTRIRREVIGQMLDYAANGVAYWPVATLQASFAATWKDKADQTLAEFLDTEISAEEAEEAEAETDPAVEEFWQKVSANLEAGRLRLLFVADVIPKELQRVVEFLNEKMDGVEVLAVEIKQFVSQKDAGPQMKTLVPRVIGQTAKAITQKSGSVVGGGGRQWDEASFFEDMEARNGAKATNVARSILQWVPSRGIEVRWGKGKADGSCNPFYSHNGKDYQLLALWTKTGNIEFTFEYLANKPPFDAVAKREEYRDKLNAISGINIPPDKIPKRPNESLTVFSEPEKLSQLKQFIEWVIQEIKAT